MSKTKEPRVCWKHSKLRERHRISVSLEPTENTILPTPWFQPSARRPLREYISVVLSLQVCGDLLWQLWESNTIVMKNEAVIKHWLCSRSWS
jgi:hypothetical protein